jgi:hypothetical protein
MAENESLPPPSFHLEAGVSCHLPRRSFCIEEGGLLPFDGFIGSLPVGFRKQYRSCSNPSNYFPLTMFAFRNQKSPVSSSSFPRVGEGDFSEKMLKRFSSKKEHLFRQNEEGMTLLLRLHSEGAYLFTATAISPCEYTYGACRG